MTEDGQIRLVDSAGREIDGVWLARARKRHKDTLLDLLEREAAERNEQLESLERLHLAIPHPGTPPRYDVRPFDEPPPPRPTPAPPRAYGLLDRLFRSRRERVDVENEQLKRDNARVLAEWETRVGHHEARRRAHEINEARAKQIIEVDVHTDPNAMEHALQIRLERLTWPRETQISFEIDGSNQTVRLDVDLPEIEDMPNQQSTVAKGQMMLIRKPLSEKRLRELYMRHVHSTGLRIVGEVFATLPCCQRVVLSAYSQRPDPASGRIEDQYLYSALITREQWLAIDFGALPQLDPVGAFERFTTVRKVTKTGVFKPIEPIAG